MGKIIQFAGKRSYKITIICLAFFGALFMIMGAVFSITSSTTTPIGMAVAAPNSYRGADGAMKVHVFARITPIQVNTWPFNETSLPVRFMIQSGRDLVHITPSIRSGGTAILTLRDNPQGIPFFHGQNDPDTKIVINVLVGSLVEILHIRIHLDMDQVDFTTHIERLVGISWVRVPIFDQSMLAMYVLNPASFRLNSTFRVFGQVIASTVNNIAEFDQFNIREIYRYDPSDIVFAWQWMNSRPIFDIPEWVLTFSWAYEFEVSFQFLGNTFRDYFRIEIAL